MKMKKILTLALTAIMAVSALAMSGCTKTTNPASSQASSAASTIEQKPATISFYGGWTGADLEKMKALVEKFNKSQTLIKVEFTSLQWTQMFTKYLADYQAGNPPEVFAMHTFELGQFVDMGVVDDKAISAMALKEADFIPTAWAGTIYNGKQYGVPLDVNMHALYYNKDLFKKAGVEKAPATKDEFIATAQKLTIDKNGKNASETGFDAANIAQYGFGFAMNHHSFYQMYALMNQNGYNPFTADMTKITLDKAKLSPAIQYIEDLIFKYKVVPIGEKSPMDDFKAGKVAMVIDGNWQLSGLAAATFDWATAEYPQIFGEKAVWGASELLVLTSVKNADENKKMAASTFVKWLSANSADWALSGQIPANLAAQSAATKLKGIDAFTAELSYVKFLPAHPKAVKIFSSAAPSPILTAAQNMTLNNKAPNDIITQFETDINAVLAQ